jgi:hypothetical protein
VRGFNPIDVLRYKEFLQMIHGSDEPLKPLDRMFTSALLGSFPLSNPSLADLLGVRYLVQPANLPLAETVPDLASRQHWRLVLEDAAPATFQFIPSVQDCGMQPLPPYRVYENSQVLPRAFIVPQAEALPERPDVLEALRSTDFRQKVLLEDWQPSSDVVPPRGAFRPAKIREYRPNQVVVEVDGDTPGFLVLADIWFPGWRCTVEKDGAPEPAVVHRANFLFRGVAIPAGARRVIFTFEPVSYDWGRLISAGSVLAVVLWTLVVVIVNWRRLARKQSYSCASGPWAVSKG